MLLSYFKVKVETLLLLFITENFMKHDCYGETGKKIYVPVFWDVMLFVRIELSTFWRIIVAFPSGRSSSKGIAMLEDTAFAYIFYRFARLLFLHSSTLLMNPSKRWKFFTQRHSAAFQKSWSLKQQPFENIRFRKLLFFHRVEKSTAVHESRKFHSVHTIAHRHW